MSESSVPGLVEHLFRHEAGRMIAGLGRRLGSAHLDLAEEAVQDALLLALRQWPFVGVPENPAAWLSRTARHCALDRLRRRAAFARATDRLAELVPRVAALPEPDEQLDDQLAMIFACCHPALPSEGRVALTLKVVCGFSTAEIARAFLIDETTMAQRIVRAKRLLRETSAEFAVPPPNELAERLDSVLQVLYLLFNEGYSAHQGEDLVRHDLCNESLRLALMLTNRADTAQPKTHALVALLCFHASRLPARVDGAGELLRLADQDRSQWDRRFMFAGLRHLDRASEGNEMSAYHIEAGIAAIHAQAESDAATNWPQILWLYDRLMECRPSPVVALNRAVAVARVEGAERGLAELAAMNGELPKYYLLHAVRADLHRQLGHDTKAAEHYRAALDCTCTEPERRFLSLRLAECAPDDDSGRGVTEG
jgi:RNA polymerase sigma-70 factor (ECF subfamily)